MKCQFIERVECHEWCLKPCSPYHSVRRSHCICCMHSFAKLKLAWATLCIKMANPPRNLDVSFSTYMRPRGLKDHPDLRSAANPKKLSSTPAAMTSAGGRQYPSFEKGLQVVSQTVPLAGTMPSSKYALMRSLKHSLQPVGAAQCPTVSCMRTAEPGWSFDIK